MACKGSEQAWGVYTVLPTSPLSASACCIWDPDNWEPLVRGQCRLGSLQPKQDADWGKATYPSCTAAVEGFWWIRWGCLLCWSTAEVAALPWLIGTWAHTRHGWGQWIAIDEFLYSLKVSVGWEGVLSIVDDSREGNCRPRATLWLADQIAVGRNEKSFDKDGCIWFIYQICNSRTSLNFFQFKNFVVLLITQLASSVTDSVLYCLLYCAVSAEILLQKCEKWHVLQVYNLSQNIQEDDLQHLQVKLFNLFD